MPSRRQHEENERDCRTIVQQLVSSIPHEVLTSTSSFLEFANYYREFIKGYADKVYPMQKLMRNKGKKFEWNDEAQVAFENIKRELCEAPELGMPT